MPPALRSHSPASPPPAKSWSHTLSATSPASPSGVSFEDRGEQALKGVGEAVRVWAVHRQAHEGREGQGRWTRRPSSTPRPPTV
jgi:hypothetical protein